MPQRLTTGDDRGVSLIELLVAVLVLSIAVVGLFRVFGAGAGSAGSEVERQLGLIVAQNRAEEIALGIPGLADVVTMAGREWRILAEDTATSGGYARIALTASPAEGGAAVQLVTYAKGGQP